MGFFLLAGLFAAAAGIGFMSDDDADAPDSNPANPNRNSGGGTGDDDGDDGTPSGPRGTAEGDDMILSGDDKSHGLGGNDVLTASGRAIAHGDTGKDEINLSDRSTGYGGFGDDLLEGTDNSTAFGGEGDDEFAMLDNSTAYGDAGSDLITASGSSTAYGGDGDDQFRGSGNATLSGDAGADSLFFFADRSEGTASLFGGSGNDGLNANGGTGEGADRVQAFGGDGDDQLMIRGRAHGFGGAGNDTLFSDDGGTLTGGQGSDDFLVSLLDFTGTWPTEDTVTITDFDRSTDRIEVDLNGIPTSITLSENGTDSTLTIDWEASDADIPTSFIVLKGATGLTLQDFTFSKGALYPKIADFPPDPGDGIYDSVTQGSDAGERLALDGDQPLAMMGAGNDSVTGGDGSRVGTVTLGDGDDSFTDGGGRTVVYGGEGNDSYFSDGAELDGLTKSNYDDSFIGGAGEDSATLRATPSDAPPNTLGGTTRLSMGAGNDLVAVDRDFERPVSVSDGDGDDTISVWMGSLVTSDAGNDSITLGIDGDHITSGRNFAEIRDLSPTDRLILDIDAGLTGAVTTNVVTSNSDFGTSTWTEIYVGDDRVAIVSDQNLALDDPRLTINRGVAFA